MCLGRELLRLFGSYVCLSLSLHYGGALGQHFYLDCIAQDLESGLFLSSYDFRQERIWVLHLQSSRSNSQAQVYPLFQKMVNAMPYRCSKSVVHYVKTGNTECRQLYTLRAWRLARLWIFYFGSHGEFWCAIEQRVMLVVLPWPWITLMGECAQFATHGETF